MSRISFVLLLLLVNDWFGVWDKWSNTDVSRGEVERILSICSETRIRQSRKIGVHRSSRVQTPR